MCLVPWLIGFLAQSYDFDKIKRYNQIELYLISHYISNDKTFKLSPNAASVSVKLMSSPQQKRRAVLDISA